MFDRLSHSWELAQASAKVLKSDRELLWFPVMSLLATLVVLASFALPIIGLELLPRDGATGMAWWVIGFLFYLSQYFVIFFFNSALVGAALMRLDGQDPTLRDGLRIAAQKIVPILGYAAIAATVGVVLRAIEERAGFLGKLVTGLLGMAWTVATFLTVPLLVSKDIGPVDAVKESAMLLKKTWGQNLAGNVGIGLVFGLASFAVMLVGIGLAVMIFSTSPPLAVTIGVATAVAVLGLGVYQAALTGVYAAALYRFSAQDQLSTGFDAALLQSAFEKK